MYFYSLFLEACHTKFTDVSDSSEVECSFIFMKLDVKKLTILYFFKTFIVRDETKKKNNRQLTIFASFLKESFSLYKKTSSWLQLYRFVVSI